ARTCVLIYDVSDPSAPVKRKEVEIEGTLVTSRIVGGRLHMVQQFLPVLPALDYEYNGTDADQADAVEGNAGALGTLSLDDLIPSYTSVDAQGHRSAETPLVTFRGFFRPAEPEGGSIITITTFDLEDEALPFTSMGFAGDAHTVYASSAALFLVSNSYEERDGAWSSRTIIHRFDLNDLTDIASGTVDGWIVNQFSLGEYDGVLRIATTEALNDSPGVTNTVTCLRPEGTSLDVVGRIDGITPGERIYSARFIEDRGYLVTFVQVDPLITLDLSDPENPSILGELVLPGYSTYIHPADGNALVTLGMNTMEEGGMVLSDGVQLSLFDVSIPERPELVDRVTIGDNGTNSEALWNHKAFTFLADGNLIAFPVDIYEGSAGPVWSSTGTYSFSGLYVYSMDADEGFTYLGRIDTQPGEEYFYSTWTRGVFMDGTVHAVNAEAVRSADLLDIEHTLSRLDLD
ncbi:MAG: beta-propeller domain-containing protein, partial [Desulfobacterota bacterium]|nr:beta-propeller domain-containing protein [Thermodesulfobacteriota bacterium]